MVYGLMSHSPSLVAGVCHAFDLNQVRLVAQRYLRAFRFQPSSRPNRLGRRLHCCERTIHGDCLLGMKFTNAACPAPQPFRACVGFAVTSLVDGRISSERPSELGSGGRTMSMPLGVSTSPAVT